MHEGCSIMRVGYAVLICLHNTFYKQRSKTKEIGSLNLGDGYPCNLVLEAQLQNFRILLFWGLALQNYALFLP